MTRLRLALWIWLVMGKLSKLKSVLDNRRAQQLAAASVVATQSGDAEGSFIGSGAKLFDQIAQGFATKMADAGMPEKEIFEKTGLFKGADGRWRQELDDSQMRLNEDAPQFGQFGIRTAQGDELIEGSDIGQAYPGMLENTTVSFNPELKGRGSLSVIPASEKMGHDDFFSLQVKDSAAMGSTRDAKVEAYERALEDAAAPESVDTIMRLYGLNRDQALVQQQENIEDLKQFIAEAQDSGRFRPGTQSTILHELQHAIQTKEGFARGGSAGEFTVPGANNRAEAFDQYERLAGEVEARNAQFRRDMTPEQRRQSFPPETEDIARDKQILRFDNPMRQQSVSAFAQTRAAKAPRWRSMRRRKGQHALGTYGGAALNLAAEFMAGVNRGATDTLNFLGPDQVNAVLQLSGSQKRIPTFDDIPGVAAATQGGFMEDGTAKDIVRTAGEFTSPL